MNTLLFVFAACFVVVVMSNGHCKKPDNWNKWKHALDDVARREGPKHGKEKKEFDCAKKELQKAWDAVNSNKARTGHGLKCAKDAVHKAQQSLHKFHAVAHSHGDKKVYKYLEAGFAILQAQLAAVEAGARPEHPAHHKPAHHQPAHHDKKPAHPHDKKPAHAHATHAAKHPAAKATHAAAKAPAGKATPAAGKAPAPAPATPAPPAPATLPANIGDALLNATSSLVNDFGSRANATKATAAPAPNVAPVIAGAKVPAAQRSLLDDFRAKLANATKLVEGLLHLD